MTNERMTLSVAQLNEYVRRTLASDVMQIFFSVMCRGTGISL